MATKVGKPRTDVDWEAVELEYRAGLKSVCAIARERGVTEGAIRKRAKSNGWLRDLGARIVQQADALVRDREVRETVRKGGLAARERDVVAASANSLADAILSQRSDVRRARDIVNAQFDEIGLMPAAMDMLMEIAEDKFTPNKAGIDRTNDLYRAIISLGGRVDIAKKLSDALRTLIELERKVLKIKDDTSLEDVMRRTSEGAAVSALDAYSIMCGGGEAPAIEPADGEG